MKHSYYNMVAGAIIVAQLHLQSGTRLKPKHMKEEQSIAIGAICVLIVLTSLYIFITVFH